jgi:hypothetical protein
MLNEIFDELPSTEILYLVGRLGGLNFVLFQYYGKWFINCNCHPFRDF